MPRDGALILTDVRGPTLTIVCEPCDRRGRLSVAKLIEEHGDAKLTDLLVTSPTAPRRRCLISTTGKPPLPSGRASRPHCGALGVGEVNRWHGEARRFLQRRGF